MTEPPRLTDRAALDRARARATDDALFLHRFAADQIEERLEEVKRRFTAPAVVTPHPHLWADRLPGARLVPDTEVLDLAPGAHDLVIHAMALHWADDPVGQVVQCARALRPDGLFLAAFFGGRTLTELRGALGRAETRVAGGLSPRVAPMAELRAAAGLLGRAGLALPVADSDVLRVSYASPLALMAELRAMGEANALLARHRSMAPRALFAEAALEYGHPDPDDASRVMATFEIVHLSGWAPDASQPRPLRPGSAQARLADALGTAETPLRDDSLPGRD